MIQLILLGIWILTPDLGTSFLLQNDANTELTTSIHWLEWGSWTCDDTTLNGLCYITRTRNCSAGISAVCQITSGVSDNEVNRCPQSTCAGQNQTNECVCGEWGDVNCEYMANQCFLHKSRNCSSSCPTADKNQIDVLDKSRVCPCAPDKNQIRECICGEWGHTNCQYQTNKCFIHKSRNCSSSCSASDKHYIEVLDNDHVCPCAPDHWLEWGQWECHSADPCLIARYRNCSGVNCTYAGSTDVQLQSCDDDSCKRDDWLEWGPWECHSADPCFLARYRNCSGTGCGIGGSKDFELLSCNSTLCERDHWLEWGPWGCHSAVPCFLARYRNCSGGNCRSNGSSDFELQTCDSNHRCMNLTRTQLYEPGCLQYGGSGEDCNDTAAECNSFKYFCNTVATVKQICPRTCGCCGNEIAGFAQWGSWSPWKCHMGLNSTCIMTRHRDCSSLVQNECQGTHSESLPCTQRECPAIFAMRVDCGLYDPRMPCKDSGHCAVLTALPELVCIESSHLCPVFCGCCVVPLIDNTTPVFAQWGTWSSWKCQLDSNSTCFMSRSRNCSTSAQSECQGDHLETHPCTQQNCPAMFEVKPKCGSFDPLHSPCRDSDNCDVMISISRLVCTDTPEMCPVYCKCCDPNTATTTQLTSPITYISSLPTLTTTRTFISEQFSTTKPPVTQATVTSSTFQATSSAEMSMPSTAASSQWEEWGNWRCKTVDEGKCVMFRRRNCSSDNIQGCGIYNDSMVVAECNQHICKDRINLTQCAYYRDDVSNCIDNAAKCIALKPSNQACTYGVNIASMLCPKACGCCDNEIEGYILWGSWSQWVCKNLDSGLNTTCHMSRHRLCTTGIAADCEGSTEEIKDCQESECTDETSLSTITRETTSQQSSPANTFQSILNMYSTTSPHASTSEFDTSTLPLTETTTRNTCTEWGYWHCHDQTLNGSCEMTRIRELSDNKIKDCLVSPGGMAIDTRPCTSDICPAHRTDWTEWKCTELGTICIMARFRGCSTGNFSNCGEEWDRSEQKHFVCDNCPEIENIGNRTTIGTDLSGSTTVSSVTPYGNRNNSLQTSTELLSTANPLTGQGTGVTDSLTASSVTSTGNESINNQKTIGIQSTTSSSIGQGTGVTDTSTAPSVTPIGNENTNNQTTIGLPSTTSTFNDQGTGVTDTSTVPSVTPTGNKNINNQTTFGIPSTMSTFTDQGTGVTDTSTVPSVTPTGNENTNNQTTFGIPSTMSTFTYHGTGVTDTSTVPSVTPTGNENTNNQTTIGILSTMSTFTDQGTGVTNIATFPSVSQTGNENTNNQITIGIPSTTSTFTDQGTGVTDTSTVPSVTPTGNENTNNQATFGILSTMSTFTDQGTGVPTTATFPSVTPIGNENTNNQTTFGIPSTMSTFTDQGTGVTDTSTVPSVTSTGNENTNNQITIEIPSTMSTFTDQGTGVTNTSTFPSVTPIGNENTNNQTTIRLLSTASTFTDHGTGATNTSTVPSVTPTGNENTNNPITIGIPSTTSSITGQGTGLTDTSTTSPVTPTGNEHTDNLSTVAIPAGHATDVFETTTSLSYTIALDTSINPNILGVCNFDSDNICIWTQSNEDSFDWTLQSGPTLTDLTGPNNDHTLQTEQGKYLFIETSAPRVAGEQASIVSPELPSDHTVCLEFWYYMFGDGIGNLQVHAQDIFSKNEYELFKADGDHGEQWFKASVTIFSKQIPNNYRLVITANVGPTYKGDTSIDDLALLDGACADTTTTSTDMPTPDSTSTAAVFTTTLGTSMFTTSETTQTTAIQTTKPAGHWSQWFVSECSVTCGNGTQPRVRFCSTGQNGDCVGLSSDSIPCNEQNCSPKGQWSVWFHGACSKTCGDGTQQRVRQCSTGRDSDCPGNAIETNSCKLVDCIIAASWSDWFYGECSKTCGDGHQQKFRHCSTGNSIDCLGSPLETVFCKVQDCPGFL